MRLERSAPLPVSSRFVSPRFVSPRFVSPDFPLPDFVSPRSLPADVALPRFDTQTRAGVAPIPGPIGDGGSR